MPQNLYATNIDQAIEAAKVNNRIIKLEDHKLKSTKTLKTQAVAEFLPKVSASGQYGQRKSNMAGRNNDYNQTQTEELRAEQPIFNGFGSVAKYNEASYRVKSATSQNQSKKQEVTLAAIKAYCDLYFNQESLKSYKESKDFAAKIFALIRRRGDARIMDEAEVIKFNYELSVAENRYFEAVNKYARAEYEYKNVVGDLHQNLTMPRIKEEKFDDKVATQNALENNHVVKSYRYNYMASKSAYNAEKSSLLPKVAVVGSVMREKNPVYLNGQDYINRGVYVTVSVPIFQQGLEYANISKAGHESSAAREEYEIAQDNLVKDLNQAISEYNFYQKLAASSRKLSELAQNRAAILMKRFNAGVEDPIEVLRAKIEMNDRNADFLNAQMNLVVAYYNIKYFLGEI